VILPRVNQASRVFLVAESNGAGKAVNAGEVQSNWPMKTVLEATRLRTVLRIRRYHIRGKDKE
jgi:2-phosphoglycerate kinase